MALRGVVLALITSCGDSMPPAFDAGGRLVAPTGIDPRRIRDADSIELLRITNDFAEPFGRENPP